MPDAYSQTPILKAQSPHPQSTDGAGAGCFLKVLRARETLLSQPRDILEGPEPGGEELRIPTPMHCEGPSFTHALPTDGRTDGRGN